MSFLPNNGKCIVTKERAAEESGVWFVEEGELTLIWDNWNYEGLRPSAPVRHFSLFCSGTVLKLMRKGHWICICLSSH